MPLFYLFYFWLLFSSKIEVTKIARTNRLITEAEESFKSGKYIAALVKYRYLTNSMQIRDSHILLNLAHCYYLNQDKKQAQKYYEQLIQSSNTTISSVALQQLGVIAFENQEFKHALQYFKQSLSIDPGNDASRYNYELVARLLPSAEVAEEEKEIDKKSKEDPPSPENENQISQSETQTEDGQDEMDTDSEQQQEVERKLRQINLSEEKAKMILDAMKNSEIQYIQQRKKQASGEEAKNQPDW